MGIIRRRPGPPEIGMLYRQLAVMIGSGVPVPEAIQVLSRESESKSVLKMAGSISDALQRGKGLQAALAPYPAVFNDFVRTLLTAKMEDHQKVSAALHDLADATEDAGIIRIRFLQALYIPVVELIIGILILAFVSLFVIPVFEDMFYGMGAALPLPTLVVVRAGGWIGQHLIYLLIAVVLLVFFLLKSRTAASMLVSVVPGLNLLSKQLSLLHFTRHLRILITFDMPLREAVAGAAATVRHVKHARRLSDAAVKATGATQLETALASTGLFAGSILHMIRYGSRSEHLSQTIEKVADYYRMAFDRRMARVFPRMQICGMLIAGFVLGFIVTALYLPVFKMAGSI